jgi:hypothetical protein
MHLVPFLPHSEGLAMSHHMMSSSRECEATTPPNSSSGIYHSLVLANLARWHHGRPHTRRTQNPTLQLLLHVSDRPPSRYNATFLEKYIAKEASRRAIHVFFVETIFLEADLVQTIQKTIF